MKYIKPILFGTMIIIGIISFFVPLISINNTAKSALILLKSSNFTVYSFLILLPIIMLLASGIMMFFSHKKEVLIYISFLLTLISGLMFLFIGDIYSGALVNDEIIKTYFVSYIIGVLTTGYSVYLVSFIFDKTRFSVRDMIEIAMLIGLAVILDLSFFKFKIVANGGSISFVMVPLVLIALRHGFVKGFISTGIIFGLTTCLLDGYGFFTFPFDYLLGFGSMALVGLFKKYILQTHNSKLTILGILILTLSFLVAIIGRTISSTISGMLFYGLGFIDSLIYQLTYIGPSAGICLVALILLYKPLLVINRLYPAK